MMQKNVFHSAFNFQRLLLATGLIATVALTGCYNRYSPIKQVPERGLELIITDAQKDRKVYLDRNSVNPSKLNANWRHATIITSFDNSTEEQMRVFGASAATEVTFDCTSQALRFDLIRTYQEPMAQGVPQGTATYNSHFETIKENDTEGMTMFNAVCADFVKQNPK